MMNKKTAECIVSVSFFLSTDDIASAFCRGVFLSKSRGRIFYDEAEAA